VSNNNAYSKLKSLKPITIKSWTFIHLSKEGKNTIKIKKNKIWAMVNHLIKNAITKI
jgi:hypothetical protein